jgi:ElaB/YqjD/DUF883 family membrane-anchored ribosome-binding protein
MADETTHGTPPADTEFTPTGKLADEGATFESDTAGTAGAESKSEHAESKSEHRATGAAGAFFEQASKFYGQAGDQAKAYAESGKARAGDALDQFTAMLSEAAAQVEERLGADYGKYARQAAETVGTFSEQLKAKDVDALVADARGFVTKSPAIAIGTAAALGFVVARLAKAGMDAAATPTDTKTDA